MTFSAYNGFLPHRYRQIPGMAVPPHLICSENDPIVVFERMPNNAVSVYTGNMGHIVYSGSLRLSIFQLEEERHLWRVRRVNNFVIMTEPGWPFSRSTFTRNIHWRAVYLLTRQRFRPFGPLLLPRQRLDFTERHFPVNVSRALLWSRIAQNRFSDGLVFYIQNKY